MKEFYRVEEASIYLTRKLDDDFTVFDVLLSTAKNGIKLCFYHSGFIGVSPWDRCSGEAVNRRIPFDGVLEIPSIMHIQEAFDEGALFITSVKPIHWIRHEQSKSRLIEDLSKYEQPEIYMVDHTNLIHTKHLSLERILISQENLTSLMIHLKTFDKKTVEIEDIKKLSTRTKNNYLRLIMKLANGIKGFNPKNPYKSAELIINETEIDLDAKTVAGYITEAYELESKESD